MTTLVLLKNVGPCCRCCRCNVADRAADAAAGDVIVDAARLCHCLIKLLMSVLLLSE